MKRLIGYVHVDGVAYGPDDEIPAAVRRRIGDHAWADVAEAPVIEPDDDQGGDVPPRSGRGSGVEAWRTFAEKNNVGTDSDMSREDIIAACERDGVVEPEQPKE
ncbi:hypothetical protein OIE71_04750 [Streptomyces sp. NBC_01725]|uniref:hypothetical protein n=1 Tax=Streptomyces sp. NBC_01725 TaxID=2975923 RepID=UPI002E2CB277|nr:hypothetical protein [Streptomyces sp. NBC_01725]